MDLAQVTLERGFPAIVTPFGTRRLPFPSGTFDTIHCGECQVHWQSNGSFLCYFQYNFFLVVPNYRGVWKVIV